ncbi:hypothetical protein AWB85_19090 [Mycobacteroides immunogenum]|uniref:FAD-binding PCMH-type domain-containing protein n=1 Tax=Mycobacteroides immunogenum TaxID=83262 RepID=A0A179VFR2_9MYCO|nr:hypothetical protein AWB85_19090 [Mycobacteroides immunogenum]
MKQIIDSLRTLSAELISGTVILDETIIDSYRRDQSIGYIPGRPYAVMRPTSAAEVQRIMRWASMQGVSVTPRGAGSGLAAAAEPADGSIVISSELLTSIEILPELQMAAVEPGALNGDIKKEAKKFGLWYPPDPASYEFCSIGGNVATNAGGLCCVKYGVTRSYVLGMEVVLANGSLVRLGGPRLKDAAGYQLKELFIGSEGTLGFISKVLLRLVPHMETTGTIVAVFRELDAAAQAVVGVKSSYTPSMLELMDVGAINAVEDATLMGLDRSAAAMLVIQTDDEHAKDLLAGISKTLEKYSPTEMYSTMDSKEGETFIQVRRLAFQSIEKYMGAGYEADIAVPVPRLPAFLGAINEIARKLDVRTATVAHAGDGNLHIAIIPPEEPTTIATRNSQLVYDAVFDHAIACGGTITGEHGVGRLKSAWLSKMLAPEVLELQKQVKQVFDPSNLLNPGVIFEPAEGISQGDGLA